jgi:hypothetical protein
MHFEQIAADWLRARRPPASVRAGRYVIDGTQSIDTRAIARLRRDSPVQGGSVPQINVPLR